ncbi:MAG: ribonuclease J [Tissierellia bacterium]|nr:ribonuclease J [Tissierellia bacterium]
MSKVNTLNIVALGGLQEIGKNITAFEYKDQIVIVDCGMTFPTVEMLGVDIVIPDFQYLEKNRSKIKALLITHGHEDHIGAIPYFLKKIQVPIYATRLTAALITNKLKEHKIEPDMHIVNYGDTVNLGPFKAEFICMGHSIPDTAAIILHTPVGIIVHTGDFKVDYTPVDGDVIDLGRLAEVGNKGVALLLADSTNVERPGFTLSESTIGETFMDLFSKADGRIIVATFASNVHRVQQIITAAEKYGRYVALSGRSMLNVVNTANDLGYLKMNPKTLIDIRQIQKYPENKVCLITTGSQGEPMSAMTRIAMGEHRNIKLNERDTVIISAHPIPGNEDSVSVIINKLMEQGAKVIYDKLADVHVSGHACQEELKLIHTLVKPKFFMPVHGETRHLLTHKKLAMQLGMPEENIFVQGIGDMMELTKKSMKHVGSVPHGSLLVDGLGVGDVGNIVLRDRKHLSEDGLIVVVMAINEEYNEIMAGPDIFSRGFVYEKENEDLLEEALQHVRKVVRRFTDKEEMTDINTMRNTIRDELRKFIYNKIKRNPMILPIIMEV